ncbi:MAG: cation transporter [Lachnospiraceae bacterium]|nr:cation transporter [Lachnospiraceae bacterium]MBP5599508.1 cation transporter [Lachnospiraceae bacterium]
MKRTFILEDLDCAHCAQKIEDAVAKLDGVSNCKVTFLTQKLVYDVEDDKNDAVEKEMKKVVKSTEPDVTVKAV